MDREPRWPLWLVVGCLTATVFYILALAAQGAGPPLSIPTPASEVRAAYAALLRVREEDQRFVQFFTLYHMSGDEREEFLKVMNVHVNRLSRRPNLRKPVLVTPTLLMVDRRHYGWLRATVNLLANVDPHFHAKVKVRRRVKGRLVLKEVTINGDGSDGQRGLIDPVLIEKLAFLTRSDVPILRGDWFFRQTAISKGRKAGYYAFLGLKKRADFDKLVGFDKKLAQAAFREVATIVQSGEASKRKSVAQRNRQIFRFGSTDGGYWETRDQLVEEIAAGNAINQLDADYVFQALEIFGVLPNDLFAYVLAANDKAGTLQETAPDEVGPDSTSTSRDGKIHPYLSCARCHVEGLRPIRDYARVLFRGKRKLVVLDGTLERKEQLYLRDFERKRKADNARYAAALVELNGVDWTPLADSEALRDVWKRWNDVRVDRAEAAHELGLGEAEFAAALEHYSTPIDEGGLGQILPNALLAFTGEEPLLTSREQWDEHFGLAILISRGVIPSPPVVRRLR